jgi:hypothetical protein
MAKRKLTDKLKQRIKDNPYKFKKSEYSGEALAYINRIRGARKASKTKAEKKKYKAPRRKSEAAPFTSKSLIALAAKAKGMTEKQYRKKYAAEVEEFEEKNKLFFNRDIELLKRDAKFLERGNSVYINGKKVRRDYAKYLLVRLQNKMQGTGLIYDKIPIEHYTDGKGNLHIELPHPDEYSNADGKRLLEFISNTYPNITYYLRK